MEIKDEIKTNVELCESCIFIGKVKDDLVIQIFNQSKGETLACLEITKMNMFESHVNSVK